MDKRKILRIHPDGKLETFPADNPQAANTLVSGQSDHQTPDAGLSQFHINRRHLRILGELESKMLAKGNSKSRRQDRPRDAIDEMIQRRGYIRADQLYPEIPEAPPGPSPALPDDPLDMMSRLIGSFA